MIATAIATAIANRPTQRKIPMGTKSDYAYGKSRFMKAEQLVGKTVRAVISNVEDVEFEDVGCKPVLTLEGKDKGFVVNATNFDILADGLGNNTNDWIGHAILLKGEKVLFKGKRVDSIRVSVPAPQAKPKQVKQPEPDPDLNDEVPEWHNEAPVE
jgi:hypothetical protein